MDIFDEILRGNLISRKRHEFKMTFLIANLRQFSTVDFFVLFLYLYREQICYFIFKRYTS